MSLERITLLSKLSFQPTYTSDLYISTINSNVPGISTEMFPLNPINESRWMVHTCTLRFSADMSLVRRCYAANFSATFLSLPPETWLMLGVETNDNKKNTSPGRSGSSMVWPVGTCQVWLGMMRLQNESPSVWRESHHTHSTWLVSQGMHLAVFFMDLSFISVLSFGLLSYVFSAYRLVFTGKSTVCFPQLPT